MNKERLSSMIGKLNTVGADVVIFGGDMFSNPQTKAPDSQMSKDLTTILKSIDAPLGKFAVLGDEDLANDKTKSIVSQILYDSDFEILSDTSIRLRNKGDSSKRYQYTVSQSYYCRTFPGRTDLSTGTWAAAYDRWCSHL